MVSEAAEVAQIVLCLESRLGGTPSTNPLPFTFSFPSLSKTYYDTTLANRWLVGVEFKQVSNLPEKNIQKYIFSLRMV